jgi:hypothetical protein
MIHYVQQDKQYKGHHPRKQKQNRLRNLIIIIKQILIFVINLFKQKTTKKTYTQKTTIKKLSPSKQ